ncbi:MAG TPA: TPM domain-containing protein, partial [Gemmatimonadales bacterium]|nr:TPM domain-containing protein [Gemmatimonadales bacterium]
MSMLGLLVIVAQLQIPAPVGYVNDFARVVAPAAAEAMQRAIERVRATTGGEIVVVTLEDLGGRPAIEVARDIGRQWRVGRAGAPGEPARNTGVVLLLKPGRRPGDGQAEIAIATGTGAEGFVTDALAGRIRREIGRVAVESERYDAGLVRGVELLAELFEREFGTAHPEGSGSARRSGGRGGGPSVAVILVVFMVLAAIAAMNRGSRPLRYGRGGGLLEGIIIGSILSGRRGRDGWGGGF